MTTGPQDDHRAEAHERSFGAAGLFSSVPEGGVQEILVGENVSEKQMATEASADDLPEGSMQGHLITDRQHAVQLALKAREVQCSSLDLLPCFSLKSGVSTVVEPFTEARGHCLLAGEPAKGTKKGGDTSL